LQKIENENKTDIEAVNTSILNIKDNVDVKFLHNYAARAIEFTFTIGK
jgi:hypothetical protein